MTNKLPNQTLNLWVDECINDGFLDAMIEALLFTECGPDTELYDFAGRAEFSAGAKIKLTEWAAEFLRAVEELPNYEKAGHSSEYDNTQLSGHDYIMSRNGHGCGFWEHDKDPIFAKCQQACEGLLPIHVYAEHGFLQVEAI